MLTFDEVYEQQLSLGKPQQYAWAYAFAKHAGKSDYFATNYAVACTLMRVSEKTEHYTHVYSETYARYKELAASDPLAHYQAGLHANEVSSAAKPPVLTAIDEQMKYYSKFKDIITHCKNKGARTWDDLKPQEQEEATYYLLRSDVGSEIVADSEDLNLAIAEGIFSVWRCRSGYTPLFKNAKNHVKDVLDKQVSYYADKVFDEPEEV